jgi:DNA-binding NarL/FixJ family response regulator
MKIKIQILDDHPLVITGLKHIFSNCPEIEIVGTFVNGNELLRALATEQADVLLLDIQLPGMTGDELVEVIKKQFPEVKILILTNFDNVFYVKNLLKKGANGYILKTTNEDVLLDAIKSVYEGKLFLEPILREKVLQDTLQVKQTLAIEPVITRMEKEIMQLIAADLTSQEIADKLFLSKRTIDNYRLSLLMKLGVKNPAGLVKRAIQLGLID